MKVVILAGGLGTRISEESHLKPKPMIEIGGVPILIHIMKIYTYYGFNDFIICAGYKQQYIKQYFANYYLYENDVVFHIKSGKKEVLCNTGFNDWNITVCNTGLHTETGGRIKRIQKYIGDEPFMVTYGDGVGDVNIRQLIETHKKSNKIGTISVYNFGQSKGVVDISEDGSVKHFREKSDTDGNLINIGFMIFEPTIFNYIKDDSTIFERESLVELAKDNQLGTYLHKSFWQCMDTLNEKNKLEALWSAGNAPWKVWKEDQ